MVMTHQEAEDRFTNVERTIDLNRRNSEAAIDELKQTVKYLHAELTRVATITTSTHVDLVSAMQQGPRGRSGPLDFQAAKGCEPKTWEGTEDKKQGYDDYRTDIVNWGEALITGVNELFKEIEMTAQNDTVDVDLMSFSTKEVREAFSKHLYIMIHKTTAGAARRAISSAKQNDGVNAWHLLSHYAAPKSKSDRFKSLRDLTYPERTKNEKTLLNDLNLWEKQLYDHEARFGRVPDDVKFNALSMIAPEGMIKDRLAGIDFKDYAPLRQTIKKIATDRTTSAWDVPRTIKTKAKNDETSDPMDIGQVAQQHGLSSDEMIMAVNQWKTWGSAKGAGKNGKGPSRDQQQSGHPQRWSAMQDNHNGKGGKSKGKGTWSGMSKGQGKADSRQCFRCKGYGHISRNCPSAKGSIYEVEDECEHRDVENWTVDDDGDGPEIGDDQQDCASRWRRNSGTR